VAAQSTYVARPVVAAYRAPVVQTYTSACMACPTPVAPAYPVAAAGPRVYVHPKVYVEGQPLRNLLTAITP
jgi:hypothetical protein